MPCGHGALSGTTSKAIVVEPPRKQGALSGTTDELSKKESKASHEAGMPSGAAGKVFIEKGKAIPSMA